MGVFLFWIEAPKSSPQPAPASIFTSNWQFFCFEMPHSAFRFTSTSTPIPLWIYPFESLKPKVTNRTPTLLFFQLSEAPTPQRHSNCGPQKPFWHWMNETDIDFRWGFPVECSGGHKINMFSKCKHMSIPDLILVQIYVYAKPSMSHRNQPSTGGTSGKGLKFQYSRAQFRDISVIFSNVCSQVKLL